MTSGHRACCPGHTKHSVCQGLHQLLPLCCCSLSPSLHLQQQTHLPHLQLRDCAPTPSMAMPVEPKPSHGIHSSGPAPRAGHDTPSSWRPLPQWAVLMDSPAIQPCLQQCSLSLPHLRGSPCPAPPAPPAGSAPLPWTHCRLGGPSRSRAQGLAEHANKVNAGTQNVPFLATKLSETEVRI